MYSTCLFCKHSLGANEAIEQFRSVAALLSTARKAGSGWIVGNASGGISPHSKSWEASIFGWRAPGGEEAELERFRERGDARAT